MSEASKENIFEDAERKERLAFLDAGWVKSGVRPLAPHPTNAPEGTVHTMAEQRHKPSIWESWEKEGDVIPPDGIWESRSVHEVKEGKWELIKEERADDN